MKSKIICSFDFEIDLCGAGWRFSTGEKTKNENYTDPLRYDAQSPIHSGQTHPSYVLLIIKIVTFCFTIQGFSHNKKLKKKTAFELHKKWEK